MLVIEPQDDLAETDIGCGIAEFAMRSQQKVLLTARRRVGRGIHHRCRTGAHTTPIGISVWNDELRCTS